jgi:hypothetical protein
MKRRRRGNQAVSAGVLVKADGQGSKAPIYLDVPSGHYAKGQGAVAAGSRAEALARWQAAEAEAALSPGGSQEAVSVPADFGNDHSRSFPDGSRER